MAFGEEGLEDVAGVFRTEKAERAYQARRTG